ncbi:Uncharacterised protein [Chlamydia abortus]|nr:Uncharacterised protein [Chlamydia abortus]
MEDTSIRNSLPLGKEMPSAWLPDLSSNKRILLKAREAFFADSSRSLANASSSSITVKGIMMRVFSNDDRASGS